MLRFGGIEVFKVGKVYGNVTALNLSLPLACPDCLAGNSWDAAGWTYEKPNTSGVLWGFGSVPLAWLSRCRGCLPTLPRHGSLVVTRFAAAAERP